MSLYKRLHDVQGTPEAGVTRRDPVMDELRQRIHHHLIEELGPILYDKRLSEDDLRRRVNEQLHATLAQERAPLSAADKAQLIQDVADDILGYGPIDRLLKDDDISEVMVNGPDSVYVERNGKLEKDGATFVDEVHLRRIIDKIVSEIGRRIDEANPLCDARLPDGSRVNAVIHPLAIGGPFLTIRKFSGRSSRSTISSATARSTPTPPASSKPAWSVVSTCSSPAVPVPARPPP
jgi:pilus assembly protein CpaF